MAELIHGGGQAISSWASALSPGSGVKSAGICFKGLTASHGPLGVMSGTLTDPCLCLCGTARVVAVLLAAVYETHGFYSSLETPLSVLR